MFRTDSIRGQAFKRLSLLSRVAVALILLLGDLTCLKAEEKTANARLERVADVLKRRCYECHSHAAKELKGGLTLDSSSGWLTGGDSGPAIVPGKAAESLLVKAIAYTDKDLQMPPKEKLPADEIAFLWDWIESGAADPRPGLPPPVSKRDWWSLRPLAKPKVPEAIGANPIDRFVRHKLSAQGLALSPPADRRTIARRLYFDLTGLPPTPADITAFVNDPDSQAYDKLVAKLLASPRYGEHWGRHWLDVVHYADTHGNDHDHVRPNAWPYRDYVIRSLNEDKPYPRFIQEQIAGDALFPDDPQATAALGFLAAGPWDHTLLVVVREDTIDHQIARHLDRDNMLSTVMSTFQSLTVHCARCHNHKFDPISQREYYALQAVFAGVDRADRPFQTDRESAAKRAVLLTRQKLLQERDPKSLAELDRETYRERIAGLEAQITQHNADWQVLEVIDVRSEREPGTTFERQADGSWLVGGKRPIQDTLVVTARTRSKNIAALKLEALADDRLPGRGPGRYDTGNFHLTEFSVSVVPPGEKSVPIPHKLSHAVSDHDETGYGIVGAIDGKVDTWWGIHPRYGQSHQGVFELARPAEIEPPTMLTIRLEFNGKDGHQMGRFRLLSSSDAVPVERRKPLSSVTADFLRQPADSPQQKRNVALQMLAEELAVDVQRELAALPSTEQFVYAATRDFKPDGSFKPAPTPRPIHLLQRGNINKPGELIPPGTLHCVPDLPGEFSLLQPEDEAQRRVALAQWLSDSRNVLTWRSIVNRVWHYHFGRGLCDTPNDLGHMGGTPSHPELIDWLAVWFRDEARGSLKALHRLIVTSETYQQASRHSAASVKVDADNRWLWRMNRNRLSAEQFRDAVLQISGRLDLTQGGPAAVQFLHRDKATFAPADGSPPFVDYENFDPDSPAHRRRAVYRFLFRTVPDPFMDALDCPDGGALTPVRTLSSSAPQALALLNDPLIIRQCEHLASRLETTAKSREEQFAAAFREILLREPRPAELQSVTNYAARHGLANACHILFNSNEFLYVD